MQRETFILRLISFSFMGAPFGNLFLSLATSGVPNWWEPETALDLMSQIPSLDWIWLFLLFLSGVLLLMRHKTAWLFAVLTLFTVVAMNMGSLMESDRKDIISMAEEVQVIFSLFATVCAILILFYARYPYLDQRQGWLRPTAERFDLQTPVRIFADDVYEGTSESLSASGCRIRLQKNWGAGPRLRFVDLNFPDVGTFRVKGQIVGSKDMVLRIKFREFPAKDRRTFVAWIQSKVQVST